MKPLLSIVITNYNYQDYIGDCVASCLMQRTIFPFEVVVIDDGSTDSSRIILNRFSDPRLSVYYLENRGIEAASNYGFSVSEGRYVVRVDADDFLLEGFVSAGLSPLVQGEADFSYSNYVVVDQKSEVIGEKTLPEFGVLEVVSRGDFLATGTIYSREMILALGGYSEAVRNCGLENFQLVLKLLAAGRKGLRIDCFGFAYRRHGLNVSNASRDKILKYGEELFQNLGLGEYTIGENHPYLGKG